jgi:hypothetical protein
VNPATQATQGPGPPAAERDAVRVAERVAAAWHSVDHSGRLDVPICVVAAIALVSTTGPDGRDQGESLTAWIRGDIAGFARTVWTATLTPAAPTWPPLCIRSWPGSTHSTTHGPRRGRPSGGPRW